MIKRGLGMLLAIAFVLSIAFVAARAAPSKQKAFASNAAAAEQVAPVANLVPVMTGYDVIENIGINILDESSPEDYAPSRNRSLSPCPFTRLPLWLFLKSAKRKLTYC